MRARRPRTGRRRGATTLAMTALLMPVLMGGVALAVDVGVRQTALAQLRTAADSAALAAVNRLALTLASGNALATADFTAAQAQAVTAAGDNKVLQAGVSLSTSDVTFGYIDPNAAANQRTFLTDTSYTPYFNAVKVTTRRDAEHSGIIPAFFGRVLGFSGSNAAITSYAMCRITAIRSLDGTTGANLLPIVLDLPTYNNMIAGLTSDKYTYNDSTGTVSSGADGISESCLYPVCSGSAGNWGTIKVGVTNNSTSTLNSQILNGITPAELATFPGGVIRVSPTTGTIVFPGNPGISAGIKSSIDQIIGKPVQIPIYDPSYGTGGNGNNATYTVVKFAWVRILVSNFQGNPKYVIIQPADANMPATIHPPTASDPADGVGIYLVEVTNP